MTGVRQACPRNVPGPPSTTTRPHQQQPVNLKLAPGLSPRATHENPLVMRTSSVGSNGRPSSLRASSYADSLIGARKEPNMMTGFGYKTAWLAFRGRTEQRVAADLGIANAALGDGDRGVV